MYYRYHQNSFLSCKSQVKIKKNPFLKNNENSNQQFPKNDGNFDGSKFKGGLSSFREYKYKDLSFVVQNIEFN